ncbi:MAG: ImmA/IrrE family metallo-endopeptidase [Ruminococcus sp.]|nr:ImmA/IrrE family metallo-endopeptidase [Ruminococcus sp.]
MDSYGIYRQTNNLIQKHGTRNPIKLAQSMSIQIYDVPEFTDLLGMYTYRWKHRMIFLNPNVNGILYNMVCGHELGHDLLHRHLAGENGLQEFQLFDMTDITEYEANAVNAHILIDEDEMVELFKQGYDIAQAASVLRVNINLLLIKVQEMNRLGMDFKLPYTPDAQFFRGTKY